MLTDITEPRPGLKPFPTPSDVFAEPVERYAEVLSPLISIDLATVNPEWRGWAHLVSPIEPFDGYLGDYVDPQHYSYHLRPNWLGFQLDDQDRYHLLGDWGFFQRYTDDEKLRSDRELLQHYQTEHESFRTAGESYRSLGHLVGGYALAHRAPAELPRLDAVSLLAQLGGQVGAGSNWVENSDGVPVNFDDGEDVYPVAENGDRFFFVASVPGWNYRCSGADDIVMFFEPNSRTVAFTFDWS